MFLVNLTTLIITLFIASSIICLLWPLLLLFLNRIVIWRMSQLLFGWAWIWLSFLIRWWFLLLFLGVFTALLLRQTLLLFIWSKIIALFLFRSHNLLIWIRRICRLISSLLLLLLLLILLRLLLSHYLLILLILQNVPIISSVYRY